MRLISVVNTEFNDLYSYRLTIVSNCGLSEDVCASVRVVERWAARMGRGVGVDSCN